MHQPGFEDRQALRTYRTRMQGTMNTIVENFQAGIPGPFLFKISLCFSHS